MKKTCALLLAFLLLCLPLFVWAEGEETPPPPPPEPEYEPLPAEYLPLSERALGDWYAELSGLPIQLTLSEDGGYALLVPGSEPLAGVWAEEDGRLILDGEAENALLVLDDVLRFDALGLIFTREKPETYAPAEPLADATAALYDGHWRAHFVALGEGTILAAALEEDTELYIEGDKLATNGARFGLKLFAPAFTDGALTFQTDQGQVTLQLLQDGFLRLTLAGDAPATLYLMPIPLPGQTPAE